MSVQQAGLNLNNNYAHASLFNANALAPVNSGYEDDLMMPDYLKTGLRNMQTGAQVQNPAQSVFTANPQQAQTQVQTVPQQPQIQEEETVTEVQPQKTNIFKILGGILGFGTPILKAASTKTFSKMLFAKVPLFAILGYSVGALIDGIFNSSKNTNEAPPA